MKHPFMEIPARSARRIFLSLLLVTPSAVMVILNLVSAPLTTPAAPLGIISYELAGSIEKAQSILDSWNASAQLHAAFALGFDYVFMLAYSTTIGLACVMASGVRSPAAAGL